VSDWLQDWHTSGDTGASSTTIARALTNERFGSFGPMTPSDASDVGRCIRLLDLAEVNGENWRGRLSEVAKRAPGYGWEKLIPRWAQIETVYHYDVKLQAASRQAFETRYGAGWRDLWTCPPSRTYELLCELRGDRHPYPGRRLPWDPTTVKATPGRLQFIPDKLGDDLTIRTQNALERAGIQLMGDLLDKTPAQLIRIRGLGRDGLRELMRVLSEYGLELRAVAPGKA
jgi:hypothetical protein